MRQRLPVAASLCLALSLLFQTASVGFGKTASLSMGRFTLGNTLSNPYYILSLTCLGLQAIAWQVALRRFPLSVAYLVMSLIYVNILLLSALWFHESVTWPNLCGAALIVAGVVLLTRGLRAERHD